MLTDDERCREGRRVQRIEAALQAGDLDALRAAVEDPLAIPNGHLHAAVGHCLVSAIYRSPVAFIRTLLELGASPNVPALDGFPPLIAALMCTRDEPGTRPRRDVDQIVRLLLEFGADPNQRGINDFTALHLAVAEGNDLVVQILLDAGADPSLRTRIDDCDTPLELARMLGRTTAVKLLEGRGGSAEVRLRAGLTLLTDIPGTGDLVRRQRSYRVRLHIQLKEGEWVRWPETRSGGGARTEDHGETLITDIRLHRGSMMSGLFYGMDGMRVGGTRRLEISPRLAYGPAGVAGVIPGNAVLVVEVTVLGEA